MMDLAVMEAVNQCGEHQSDLTEDEIVEVIASRQWCYCERRGGRRCRSYCDTNGAAVYRLRDGFATATEWSDSTGHG